MLLRQLEYLTALARERHFGRAAEACHVSQPSLSAAIRKLEQELGLPLVQRDHRYDDLTEEGRVLLAWAQRAVTTVDGLAIEASRLRGALTGTLRIGVIPTALPAVSLICGPLLDRHQGVRLQVRSLSSTEIGALLASHELDAGITYLDDEPLGNVATHPIYAERYVFLSERGADERPTLGWAELARLPLCLLTVEMQNRRIVDAAFAAAGVTVTPRVEVNSITAMLAFARRGRACVLADTWLALHGVPEGMRAIPLVDPEPAPAIGLVTTGGSPEQPLAHALRETLHEHDVEAQIRALIDSGSEPA